MSACTISLRNRRSSESNSFKKSKFIGLQPRSEYKNMTGIYMMAESRKKEAALQSANKIRTKTVFHSQKTMTEQNCKDLIEKLRVNKEQKHIFPGFAGSPLHQKQSGNKKDDDVLNREESLPTPMSTSNSLLRSAMKTRNSLTKSCDNVNDSYDLIKNAVEEHRHTLAGLDECYRKICQGNVSKLKHLLPYKIRKFHNNPSNNAAYVTGFGIRSYRSMPMAALSIPHDKDMYRLNGYYNVRAKSSGALDTREQQINEEKEKNVVHCTPLPHLSVESANVEEL